MLATANFFDVVLAVDHDDGRFVCIELFGCHQCVADDDDDVVRLDEAGGRAVEAYRTAAALSANDVRFKSCAVVVVDDLYFFVRAYSRCIEEIFVDGDTAHVVEVGFGDGGAMYFGFECFYEHADTSKMVLSMRRVVPIRTASARSALGSMVSVTSSDG